MNEQSNIPEFTDKDKRTSLFHNFEVSPELIGQLIGIENGQFGEQYRILQKDGTEIVVGTFGVLKSKINQKDVGKFIKIVSLGTKISPKSRRSYTDFDIFIK